MAHEELKALYEIDSQHSDTPWEFWEFHDGEEWLSAGICPMFDACVKYRRTPDAPVWPDDKEDARKWRELVQIYDQVSEDGGLPERFYSEIVFRVKGLMNPQPQLIQGYTAEQWRAIIDGKFLCEFSDDSDFPIMAICNLNFVGYDAFHDVDECQWKYCRPLRTKGVRQPWFGGECPVDPNARVSYVLRDGYKDQTEAGRIRWEHKAVMSDIVEFIEL